MTCTRNIIRLFAAVATVFALSFAGGVTTAAAEGGCDDDGEGSKQGKGSFKKRVVNGEVVWEYVGTIRVCGKVPKPAVILIILEKDPEYQWDDLQETFLPKIRESVKKAPF